MCDCIMQKINYHTSLYQEYLSLRFNTIKRVNKTFKRYSAYTLEEIKKEGNTFIASMFNIKLSIALPALADLKNIQMLFYLMPFIYYFSILYYSLKLLFLAN